jgi:hypothetical protein
MKRFPFFVGTGLLVACSGITDTACACSPYEPSMLITGTVKSPAMAPVPGGVVKVRLMQGESCELVEPAVIRVMETDAAGRFRHRESGNGGRSCFRVLAEPPQGSALAPSDTQFVRVTFMDNRASPDSLDLILQLR